MDPSQSVFDHSAIDPSILSDHSRVIDPSQLAIEEVFFFKHPELPDKGSSLF